MTILVYVQAADDDGGWGLGGANIPTNAKRRMEQSARLAKRVINLEKINVDLTREIDSLKGDYQFLYYLDVRLF